MCLYLKYNLLLCLAVTFTSLFLQGRILNGNKFLKIQILYTSRPLLFLLYGVSSVLSACMVTKKNVLAFYLAKDVFLNNFMWYVKFLKGTFLQPEEAWSFINVTCFHIWKIRFGSALFPFLK